MLFANAMTCTSYGWRAACCALAAGDITHLTFPDLPKLCDAFYIGGTKTGAMFGEALVLVNDTFKDHFRFNMKKKLTILAKGWMLGIQFEELLKIICIWN